MSTKYTGQCTEEIMKGLVAQYGAVSTSVASKGPMQNYGGGVLDNCV